MANITNPNRYTPNATVSTVQLNGPVYVLVTDGTDYTIAAGASSINFINLGDGAGGGTDADIAIIRNDGSEDRTALPANGFGLNFPVNGISYGQFVYNSNNNQLYIVVVY